MFPRLFLREGVDPISELHSERLKVNCSVGGGLLFIPPFVFLALNSLLLETDSVSVEDHRPTRLPLWESLPYESLRWKGNL
jgi:hypothetical protein